VSLRYPGGGKIYCSEVEKWRKNTVLRNTIRTLRKLDNGNFETVKSLDRVWSKDSAPLNGRLHDMVTDVLATPQKVVETSSSFPEDSVTRSTNVNGNGNAPVSRLSRPPRRLLPISPR
jgi:hypothetical protein